MSALTEPGWLPPIAWWLVYPLGFVGAYPPGESGPPLPTEHRLRRLTAWLEYLKLQGVNGIALGPIFASETHGYDTLDHFTIDPRLGDETDFKEFVDTAHRLGMRVQLDGVFNHVARTHPKAQQALADGPDSAAMSWFKPWELDDGRVELTNFEGSDNLVVLNHANPQVRDYVVEVMNYWLDKGVDSWRLDAAYQVPTSFWADVLPRVRETHPEAYFVAEVIHGDYAGFVAASTVDSVTQYELWKAIWSSLDAENMFELDWTLQRHNAMLDTFVPLTFIGNQDTSRIASVIQDPRHLPHAVVLLTMLGGTPTVYAGDAHGITGLKLDQPDGDDAIRQEFPADPAEMPSDERAMEILDIYRQLFALRRRNLWLHRAVADAKLVENQHIVIKVHPHPEDGGEDGRALLLLLNLKDEPVSRPADVAPHVFLACDPQTAWTGELAPHGWAVAAGDPAA